jgi:hypothetical protein
MKMTKAEVKHGQGWHDARREHEAGDLNIKMSVDSFKFDPPDTPYQKGFLDYVRFMQINQTRSHNPKFA